MWNDYVVAQMGLNNINYSAIDYMLGTISLVYYLLFITNNNNIQYNVLNIDSKNDNNTVMSKESDNMGIQSAENCKEFSETIRQLPNKITKARSATESLKDVNFFSWLAGIIDGDGNFDIRIINNKIVLKSIRIKLHNRDIRILTRIQNHLHKGRIRHDKNKPHSIYICSTVEDMKFIITSINGLIRIKVNGFIKACEFFDIEYKEANYNLVINDPYFSGLIDTDGNIIYNYDCNRIECNLEMKDNGYVRKLNLDNVIPNCKPYLIERTHKNASQGKVYYSLAFKYQNVKDMIFIYDYFMLNRLYSDFKFYRVSKIKYFIEIRELKNNPKDTIEYKIYRDFILDWVQYLNPTWNKLTYISKL